MQRYEHKQLTVIGGTSGMGLATAGFLREWLKLAASSAMT